MQTAPISADEAERIADVRATRLLDTRPEERFDRVVRLAARIFNVPIAYIALVDSDRQWFKSKCGLSVDETGRDVSFCGHAILGKRPLIVEDARLDPRFHDNPLVIGEPFVRFYAGHPLAGPGGKNVGTLCLASPEPRSLDAEELAILRDLAAAAEYELAMVNLIEAQHELIETKNALVETQRRLDDELAEAAAYVQSLLPQRLEGSVRSDWCYRPSSQLGGDLFGHHWLADGKLAIYLIDVCGHGVGASLLSSTVYSVLRREALGDAPMGDPAAVLASLNRAFPIEENNGKFFTIWYGVYDPASRRIEYASGGHPPAILIENGRGGPARLGNDQIMIGVSPDESFESSGHELAPASRLYLYSDGAYEVSLPGGGMLTLDEFVDLLAAERGDEGSRVERVLGRIQALQGTEDFVDDFSLLEVEFA